MAKKFKNTIIYYGARVLMAVVNFLPRRLCLFVGNILGWMAFQLMGKVRFKALNNLERAWGNKLTFREKSGIARRCFINYGRSALDIMRIQHHYDQIKPNIEVEGLHHFVNAYERGRGIIGFTGHIGNFELLAAYVAREGYKTAVIGRELYDKRLDRLLVQNREAMGMVNVYSSSSPKKILDLLRRGFVFGILIDTDSFRVAGEMMPFFGRPAKTPIAPTQLGLAAKAAFVPSYCLCLPDGRYKIVFEEELVPDSYDRSRENVYRFTCRMNTVLEKIIRRYPDQWIWMHNRWHNRPDNQGKEFLRSMGYGVK